MFTVAMHLHFAVERHLSSCRSPLLQVEYVDLFAANPITEIINGKKYVNNTNNNDNDNNNNDNDR